MAVPHGQPIQRRHPRPSEQDARWSLLPISHAPLGIIVPVRGVVFSGEVQCLIGVSTGSRLPVHLVAWPAVTHQKRHVKRATFRDCGRRCVYCAARLGLEAATLDHVIPLSRGGNHAPGNLVAACLNCNQLKGSMLPVEFFTRYPWAGQNFMRYARAAHRSVKRGARRAVSLAFAEAA
jgi:5-methylcytosine-specific restriction endonuclease McrA